MIWRTALPTLAGVALFAATAYQTEIAQWRQQREANLKRDGGWLSVAGLFWLHEGATPSAKTRATKLCCPMVPLRLVRSSCTRARSR